MNEKMADLLQIEKTIIEIGLKREYKFFQISDMHMSYVDSESSLIDREELKRYHKQWDTLKRDFAKQFNEVCDERYDIEPNIIFEALCGYALKQKADALILSGDIMDRVTESNLRYMRKFVSTYPIPVIYCLGNHGAMNERGEKLNQYHRFEGIIDNPEIDTFDFEEIKIVTFDNGGAGITDNQLNKLTATLCENKPTLIVVHKPLNLGEFGEKMCKELSPYFLMGVKGDSENTYKALETIKSSSKNIIGVFAGHIHGAKQYKIFGNTYQYTASSGLIGAGREIIIK